MRTRALGLVLGGTIMAGAWLTGACGSSRTFDASSAAGAAGTASAGLSSGGETNAASGAHSGSAGSNRLIETSGASQGGSADAETGGASVAGSAGLNAAGAAGLGIAGAGGAAGTVGNGSAGAGGAGGASGSGASGSGGAIGCVAGSGTWAGCQAPACGACSSALTDYRLYFKNHSDCAPIASCPNALSACSAACPAPTDADRCDGSSGEWQGCRGSGCYVCTELVANYPKYFSHHPYCVSNGTCDSSYGTCNSNCPAPVAADM